MKENEKAAAMLMKEINEKIDVFMEHSEGGCWSALWRYLRVCIDEDAKDRLNNIIDTIYDYIESYNGKPEELYNENGEYLGDWAIKAFDIKDFCDYYKEHEDELTYSWAMIQAYINLELEDVIKDCERKYNFVDVIVDEDENTIEVGINGREAIIKEPEMGITPFCID